MFTSFMVASSRFCVIPKKTPDFAQFDNRTETSSFSQQQQPTTIFWMKQFLKKQKTADVTNDDNRP